MTAYYDFYQNPTNRNQENNPTYHARVVANGTTSTDDLVRKIHSRSTLSPADIKATLIAISDVLREELEEGRQIHIEGLGYLHVTLACPKIQSIKEIRAESVRFKSIVFRPEKELKKQLRSMKVERVANKRHSAQHTRESLKDHLSRYFQAHESLTRKDFQRLCGLTRSTANRRLKELQSEGFLVNSHQTRYPIYKAGPTLTREPTISSGKALE